RYLEREEIDKLLNNCCEHLKPIVIVALHTGMRKGEILGLKWHDIEIKRNIIHLHDTKNGESREVPMNEIVQKTVIGVLKNPESQYVFCNKDGKPYGNVRKSFFTALTKAGIIDFRFHDLRHTFASQLVMSGVDLNTVRELLGHKSIEMTLRYSHLSPDHKKRAVDILNHRMTTEVAKNSDNLVTVTKSIQEMSKTNFHNSLGINQL
ncbi:MAG: site-specific integrase, partial [Candidatus Omnitrophica bacterium]|nr:site-specific integrase [Candidatus Omnitrophota bacterium]